MKNNKTYFAPRCVTRAFEPHKTLMVSMLNGGANSVMSEENGNWGGGGSSGESMGVEDGNW